MSIATHNTPAQKYVFGPQQPMSGCEAPPRPCCRGSRGKGGVFFLLIVVMLLGLWGCGSDSSESTSQGNAGQSAVAQDQDTEASAETTSFAPDTVLATVNGKELTVQRLEEAWDSLSESQQKEYGQRKQNLLETLIMRTVLLQEARSSGIAAASTNDTAVGADSNTGALGENDRITQLFEQEVLQDLEVKEEEVRRFYQENKDRLATQKSYEEIKDQLRPQALRQKQQQAVEAYVDQLLDQASITKNQEWLAAQDAQKEENPLRTALETGRPVLADFGRGSCIPCKMMEPILEELHQEYQGQAEVLVLNVDDYPALTREYSIRTIPTQIFFDASGEVVKRHEGFMSKEDLVGVLQELGVDTN